MRRLISLSLETSVRCASKLSYSHGMVQTDDAPTIKETCSNAVVLLDQTNKLATGVKTISLEISQLFPPNKDMKVDMMPDLCIHYMA